MGVDFRMRFSGTALPFVSAAGELLCVYLVFKEDKDGCVKFNYTKETLKSARGKVIFFPFASKTSYVDRVMFTKITRHFMEWYREQEPGFGRDFGGGQPWCAP